MTYHGYGPSYADEAWYQERYTNKKADLDGESLFVSNARCDVCGRTELVLVADNSQQEYGSITVCQTCLLAAFREATEKKQDER